ncbi:MAG: hypothetical protein JST84_11060 [Acidobacteria bacterium]|nr:hypothetical protein [Acidobacteriota bacterium]
MKEIILREFQAWQNIKGEHLYLDLPQEQFANDCPPMLCIGGAAVSMDQPRLIVISLEPLLDPKTYSQQLDYLSVSDIGADSRVITWQLDYFKVFPNLLAANKTSTHYWGDIHALVSGWCHTQYDNSAISWQTLASSYVEVPLIPMHARSHTSFINLPANAQMKIRKLFVERLLWAFDKYRPTAVLALGADCELETLRALNISSTGIVVPITQYKPQYGRSAKRFEKEILAFVRLPQIKEGMVFVRRAPFTNWHRPNRLGIHEIGRCLRNYFDKFQSSIT